MIDARDLVQCFPSASVLPNDAVRVFVGELEIHEYAQQAVVFAAGDVPDALYFLARGSVLVLHSSESGPAVTLGRIQRGELFGEMGVLDGSPRSASAVVEEEMQAWRLSRQSYESLRDAGHPAIDWLLRELGLRLSQRVRSVQGRIARVREQPSLANTLPTEVVQRRSWLQWLLPWSR